MTKNELFQEVFLRLWEADFFYTYDSIKSKYNYYLSLVIKRILLNIINKKRNRNSLYETAFENINVNNVIPNGKGFTEKIRHFLSSLVEHSIFSNLKISALTFFDMLYLGETDYTIARKLMVEKELVILEKNRLRDIIQMEFCL